MALVKTKALVIREQPFQDNDKLLTIFTEKEGKQRAIAKGARRKKSSLSVSTQLFSFSNMVYYPGKNFASINEAELIESFYALRQDIKKMALASYSMELLDSFFLPYEGNAQLLKVVTHVLYYWAKNMAQCDEALAVALQLKIAALQGIGPNVSHCVLCGSKENLSFFSVKNGGVICGECAQKNSSGQKISSTEHQYLKYLMKMPVKDVCRNEWDVSVIHRLFKLLNEYIVNHLGKKIKSYDFYLQLF